MKNSLLFCFFIVTINVNISAQSLSLPAIFGDQMVLQRNTETRLWGKDKPGTTVYISDGRIAVGALADENGDWEAFFPGRPAGGPYTFRITGSERIYFNDVYFGDVWIAGGQSNMEWTVGSDIERMEEELNDADYPEIRFIKIAHDVSVKPLHDLRNEVSWKAAKPEHVKDFSAVAWFFAKLNHLEKGVPVGIIDNNWGGTPAEAWTPTQDLLTVPGYEEAASEMLDQDKNWEQILNENDKLSREKYRRVQDSTDFLKFGAHTPDFDDSKWTEVRLPNTEPLMDVVWLRKSFELDTVTAAQLSMGRPGKFTVVFINGEKVFQKSWGDAPGLIQIPPEVLRKGENVIAIRTVEDWDGRSFIGGESTFWINTEFRTLSLEGNWKFSNDVEPPLQQPVRYQHKPGTLFNAMIHPVSGYTIKGAIWYQGESNTGQHQHYQKLFETMIEAWRSSWKQGNFPFMFVQLANFMDRLDSPSDSEWARLREAQTKTLRLANTGMATTIDIGETEDIHPRNKLDVGYRLWQSARHVAFKENIIHSGPQYRGHVISGDTVFVSYHHTGDGLVSVGTDKLPGFELAGSDRKFYRAVAVIENNMVKLSAEEVDKPVAVRYAWANNPEVNLYNSAGLPAVPFRTDQWDP